MKLALLAALGAVLGAAACGTPPPEWTIDAGACQPYVVPSTQDLSMPSRSFANDVMPLFTAHCAMCHGTESSPSGDVFLGKTSGDGHSVFTGIVGVPSGEYAAMSFITASDPTRSYLMHKLDGDQCQYDDKCGGGSCERTMPESGGLLTQAERDTVREWIFQGAADN